MCRLEVEVRKKFSWCVVDGDACSLASDNLEGRAVDSKNRWGIMCVKIVLFICF